MNGTEKVEQLLSSYKEPAQNVWDLTQEFTAKFLASLDDDFNTAQALSHIFELARAVNRLGACKKAQSDDFKALWYHKMMDLAKKYKLVKYVTDKLIH